MTKMVFNVQRFFYMAVCRLLLFILPTMNTAALRRCPLDQIGKKAVYNNAGFYRFAEIRLCPTPAILLVPYPKRKKCFTLMRRAWVVMAAAVRLGIRWSI